MAPISDIHGAAPANVCAQTYVEDLERLNIFFLAPLRKLAGTPGEVLPAAQVNTIFGTIDQLVSDRCMLLAELHPLPVQAWASKRV